MTRLEELEEQELDALHKAALAVLVKDWKAHDYWHAVAQAAHAARVAIAKEQP